MAFFLNLVLNSNTKKTSYGCLDSPTTAAAVAGARTPDQRFSEMIVATVRSENGGKRFLALALLSRCGHLVG